MRVANYEYAEKIGQGAFGTIFKGRNVKTGEAVVVKTEPLDTPFSTLKHESTILNLLYSKSCRNIPPTYWYGLSDNGHRVFVMPFYEETLEDLLLKTADVRVCCNVMRSAILILKSVHDKYVVHRDIKPANWMIRRNELVLIDFGLASFYVDAEERHIEPSKKAHIIGSPKWASWNVHCGEEYSRRDDLLSVVYIGMFCLEKRGMFCPSSVRFQTMPFVDDAALNHPRNLWLKDQKTLESVLKKTEQWSALKQFANKVYDLSFHERPSYDEYAELFV